MIKIITIIWAITIPPLMWTIILPVATFLFEKCHGFTENSFVYIIIFKKAGNFQVDKNLTQKPSHQTQKKGIPPSNQNTPTNQVTKTTSPPKKKKSLRFACQIWCFGQQLTQLLPGRKEGQGQGSQTWHPAEAGRPRGTFHRRLLAKSKKKCSRLCLSVWKVWREQDIYGLGMAPSQQQWPPGFLHF